VHERHQDRVIAEHRRHLLRSHDPVRPRLEVGNLESLALELPARVQHGRVLGPGRYDVAPTRTVEPCRAEEREVVRFRGAGCPDYLLGIGANEPGDLHARLLDPAPGAAAGLVADGRWIGEIAAGTAALEHDLDHPRVNRRGRRIVEVDGRAHDCPSARGDAARPHVAACPARR